MRKTARQDAGARLVEPQCAGGRLVLVGRMGKEGRAPVPSAHDRLLCPSVAGQEKEGRGRGVESGRGFGEGGFQSNVSGFGAS